jgi:hypothetical protein
MFHALVIYHSKTSIQLKTVHQFFRKVKIKIEKMPLPAILTWLCDSNAFTSIWAMMERHIIALLLLITRKV